MRRMVCLDGLRGVLACYVMLGHTLPFAALPAWLLWLFQHGGAGVDVFFILSGLVIVQSLASFSYRPRPFLIARVARIYPVYLVVFAFAVAVQPLASGFPLLGWIDQDSTVRYLWPTGWPSNWAIDIAAHLTMTHGLFPDGVLPHLWLGFLGAAWSLSTEWQFYLLALLIGARLGLRPLAWLFLALAAASIAWQAVAPEPWQFSRAFLPNKAQYFALGIASAILVREGAKGLGSYLPVLGATLVLCLVRGGADKLLPPLVWTACLAAQLLPADAPSRCPRSMPRERAQWGVRAAAVCEGDSRMAASCPGHDTAVSPFGLAGSHVVRHLSRQRTGTEGAGPGDCAHRARRWRLVHRPLAAWRGRVAGPRRMGIARMDRGTGPASWPHHGASQHGGRPLRSAPDERPVARRAALAQRLGLVAGRRPSRGP